MKYLLWALLAYLAWRWYQAQQQRRENGAAERSAEPSTGSDHGTEDGAEKMVRCAECGIHLPESEALPAPGARHFCSEAHRSLHQPR